MTSLTDEFLIKELCDGETKNLGIIYERYKVLLFNYFLRTTRDYDVSNDLLMETVERIYKYRFTYNPSKKVRPWLFQIASNLVKDFYNRSNKYVEISKTIYESPVMEAKLSLDSADRSKYLQKALETLKPANRNIINKYYLLEMSYEDIALSENISVNNARIKICRSLKKLKQLLKDSEI